MHIRLFIANIPADIIARRLSAAQFAGTIVGNPDPSAPNVVGFGPEWGMEPTTIVELYGLKLECAKWLRAVVQEMLREFGEQCALAVVDGVCEFWTGAIVLSHSEG